MGVGGGGNFLFSSNSSTPPPPPPKKTFNCSCRGSVTFQVEQTGPPTTLLTSVADPHVFGPPGSGSRSISQRYRSGSGSGSGSPSKKSKKNLDSYCFVTSFWLFIFENDVHVPSKSHKQKYFWKNLLFVGIMGRSMTEIAGSGSASGSGSESGFIGLRHGSADPDPDPDPPKNVMDPQHCS